MDGALYQKRLDNSPCNFTSTFLEKDGVVKVEVDFKLTQARAVFDDNGGYIDYVTDVIDAINLSQEFLIKSPVDTYVR